MSTEETTQPLPAGHLACMNCGIAVAPPFPVVESAFTSDRPGKNEVRLTLCPECVVTQRRARDLVEAHPKVAVQIGSDSIAVDRFESALIALEVLEANASIGGDQAMRQVLAHLSIPGASARWSSYLLAAAARVRPRNECAAERWAHLDDSIRQEMRSGLAEIFRARVQAPLVVDVTPPTDTEFRGCLWCGVASVRASAADIDRVWTHRKMTAPGLGCKANENADGYLCPVCEDAIFMVGAAGPTALERSVLTHAGLSPNALGDRQLIGLKAWAAWPGAEPNREPWEHVANLAEALPAAR